MKLHTGPIVLLTCISFVMASAQPGKAPVHEGFRVPTHAARQMILVITPDWDALGGTIRTFERAGAAEPWLAVHEPRAMTLGSTGLAWGSGLHGPRPGPIKREGDNKSPAGVFGLDMLYGYAPESEAERFSMPYLPLDSTDECVDDPSSMYYNMIVDRKNVARVDWKSAERMRFSGKYYEWGVVVRHNMDPRISGEGSCIFLHVWGGSDEPTSGCTSLDRDGLLEIMEWLSPDAHPVLVQLPESEYTALQKSWGLP